LIIISIVTGRPIIVVSPLVITTRYPEYRFNGKSSARFDQ
jgi:hypothetical protein